MIAAPFRFAALAAIALSTGAYAQLNGTIIDVEQDFADCLTIGDYTYGGSATFTSNQDPNDKWTMSGPAGQPGFEHSVLCDYAKFQLGDRDGTTSYLFLREFAVQPENGSVQAFNSAGKKIGQAFVNDLSFFIQIEVDDILAGPKDQIIVAWNSEGEPPCYPDLNGDGTLDLFDFLEFTNRFNAGDESADCDPDGSYDLFDFLCYTNAFNEGC